MRKNIFVFLWICCLTAVNCLGAIDPNRAVDGSDIKTLAGGNTDFAFAFYGKLKDDPNITVPEGEPNKDLIYNLN